MKKRFKSWTSDPRNKMEKTEFERIKEVLTILKKKKVISEGESRRICTDYKNKHY